MTDLHAALQKHFGFAEFRPGQAEAIQSLLAGKHTLAVMPTGSGKSLIFQLAALLLADGRQPAPVGVVISPLISLMKDQVDSLTRRGIPATFINSALPAAEQANRLRLLAAGQFRLAYVAPERLRSTAFRQALQKQPISLLAIDEAHCISEWGHDFRPDYLHIAAWRRGLGANLLTVALTATATPQVQQDILRLLGLPASAASIVTGFNRPNLKLMVEYTQGTNAKLRALRKLLTPRPTGATIIYAGTRRDCEEVAEFARAVLRQPAEFYHAGLPPEERTRIQEAFMSGKTHLVIATNAFGMGIDRADVRQVIHYSMPGSLEAYYQEAGRAGRDGLPSSAVLLYDPKDRALQEWFIEQSQLDAAALKTIHTALPADKEAWTTLEDLSARSGMHPTQIKVGLAALERAGILAHLGDEGVQLMLERGAWNQKGVEGALLHARIHSRHRQKMLEAMVDYAESDRCRRAIILRYFGDPDSSRVADCCDNCPTLRRAPRPPAPASLGTPKPAAANTAPAQPAAAPSAQPPAGLAHLSRGERAALIVLDCVRLCKNKVGRSKIEKILQGSKARDILDFHYDKHPYYARFAALKREPINQLILDLIAAGYIKSIGGEYPVLRLTPRGEAALQEKERIPLNYAKAFAEESVASAQAKLAAGGTAAYSASLLAQGLTPEQIAHQRGLTASTIYAHLAQQIEAGKVSVEQVVPAERHALIESALAKAGQPASLMQIKGFLPEEVSFGEIRCVMAGRKSR